MPYRHLLLAGLAAGVTALGVGSALAHDTGPINGVAAQPGSFANCTQCHIGNRVNGGNGGLQISGAPAFYNPGQTYPLTVTLDDPGQAIWGFELVALRTADDGNAGNLAPANGLVQTSVDGAGRVYAKQTQNGSFPGTVGPVSWTVNWTAPAAGSGSVAFYAAGNAGNRNGSTTGDFIYTAASAAAETLSTAEVTVVAQPDDPSVRRNDTLFVRARVRNHLNMNDGVVVVSRLRLPTGAYFPAVGWLLPPASLTLLPAGQESVDLVHPVPATAPLITATYETLMGRPPSDLLSVDRVTIQILP